MPGESPLFLFIFLLFLATTIPCIHPVRRQAVPERTKAAFFSIGTQVVCGSKKRCSSELGSHPIPKSERKNRVTISSHPDGILFLPDSFCPGWRELSLPAVFPEWGEIRVSFTSTTGDGERIIPEPPAVWLEEAVHSDPHWDSGG